MEIVVHRGANKVAPENTKAAAQACIDLSVDYVEIDVRLSKDKVPFLLHDPTVDRTTDGHGAINNLRSGHIEQLDAGSWFDPKFAGEPVPRLDTYLEWIKGKCKVFLDLPDVGITGKVLAHVIDLVYRTGIENDCFFWFKAPERAYEFRQIAPNLTLKVNADSPEKVYRAHQDYQAAIVEVAFHRFTDDYQAACDACHIKSMINEHRSDANAFKQILQSKADMINLDDPHLFLQVQQGLNSK